MLGQIFHVSSGELDSLLNSSILESRYTIVIKIFFFEINFKKNQFDHKKYLTAF